MSSAPRCKPPHAHPKPSMSTTALKWISPTARRHLMPRDCREPRSRPHKLQRLLAHRPSEHDARQRAWARRLTGHTPVLAHVRRLPACLTLKGERVRDHRLANTRPQLQRRKRRSDSLRRRSRLPLGSAATDRSAGQPRYDNNDLSSWPRAAIAIKQRSRRASSSQHDPIQPPPRAQRHLRPS